MAKLYDVSSYILHRTGKITTMKLHKLLYYSQAWYLVWNEEPLFDDDFEAWASGCVIPKLFHAHKGIFSITFDFFDTLGNMNGLTENQIDSINIVINDYNKFTPSELSSLVQQEEPWKNTRIGIPSGFDCNRVISKESLQQYYGGL